METDKYIDGDTYMLNFAGQLYAGAKMILESYFMFITD
jgi:hypothetical protein